MATHTDDEDAGGGGDDEDDDDDNDDDGVDTEDDDVDTDDDDVDDDDVGDDKDEDEYGVDDDKDHTVDLLRHSQQNHPKQCFPKSTCNNQGVVPLDDRFWGRGRQPGNSVSQD